ncbi:hypothetical protein BUALT_Bualt01G0027900 [Buddleja alternifolia]|uniref:SWIM-type domain-containing protein n=1 Tax=Buddleja alternifolia TaxID=168488 RepID=A0AAV6Y665_9LAMI|nr:hypothetical protein BUALT_Bualt01G0027900 [Buddleja alternifolia]
MDQDPHMSEFDNLNDFSASNPSGEQFGLGDSSLSGHAKVPSLSIVEELEIRLGVGQVMKSTEDTYLLYCKYAHAKGFGVKKGDQRYFTGLDEKQDLELGGKREENGRSSRNISHAQKSTMEALVNAKIPLASVLSYMEDEAQGTFLKSMGGKQPETIFTDQCQAMMNAIDTVELFESLNIQLREQPSHSGHFPRVFEMQSYGQNLKVRIVVFDVQKEEIRCSCHKFESMGILCRHALRVLNCMNVHIIPEMYIKKRWTKGMRNRLSNEKSACVSSGSENASGCGNESEMVFVNQKMRFIYDLIMQCKAHEETRNMLTESFNSVAEKTITWLENLSIKDLIACNDLISSERNNQSTEEPLRNPLSIKSRGITNACIQCHWDEKSKKGKRKGKVETSKVVVKGTKRKGKNYQITTLECPSQEATTAPNTQEPVYVQPSHYPTGQPFQETLVENQPYWSQMGGNVPSTFPFLGPNFPQGHSNLNWNSQHLGSTQIDPIDVNDYVWKDFLHEKANSGDDE